MPWPQDSRSSQSGNTTHSNRGRSQRSIFYIYRMGHGRWWKENQPSVEEVCKLLPPKKEFSFQKVSIQPPITRARWDIRAVPHCPEEAGENCHFEAIRPDEIMRDRSVFGISDNKVRERLLREAKLTLAKTDEICWVAEQMRIAEGNTSSSSTTHAMNPGKEKTRWGESRKPNYQVLELWP